MLTVVGALSLNGQQLSLLPTWFQDISFILLKSIKNLRNKSTQCGCFFFCDRIIIARTNRFILSLLYRDLFIPYNKTVATNTIIEEEKMTENRYELNKNLAQMGWRHHGCSNLNRQRVLAEAAGAVAVMALGESQLTYSCSG